VVLVIGVVVMAANLLVDVLYAVVDPRVEYGARS
jgi:ABC-type dipeptide/oligopeptide/nickel transport system permease component